jgi:DNA-binding IclR family transcriptional regulator
MRSWYLMHVAAELAIADRLVDSAKSSETLAHETKTHLPSLHRLLRALASLGVLEEVEINHFALTAMGA